MKYTYIFILFMLTLCFAACDGRDRLHKTPQDILQDTELLDSFSEKIIFIPNGYAEKTTDTLFSNGYHVHVKMYSDMVNYVSINSGKDSTNYRDFNLDIRVKKDDKVILNKTITKQDSAVIKSTNLNLNTSYLRSFWIAKNNEDYKNIPSIYYEYYSPVTKESVIMELLPLNGAYIHSIYKNKS